MMLIYRIKCFMDKMLREKKRRDKACDDLIELYDGIVGNTRKLTHASANNLCILARQAYPDRRDRPMREWWFDKFHALPRWDDV